MIGVLDDSHRASTDKLEEFVVADGSKIIGPSFSIQHRERKDG